MLQRETISSQEYLDQMTEIQKNLLDFIDNEDGVEEYFRNLINIFEDPKISNDKYLLQSLLHLISNIGNNHDRRHNLISKIERILQYFKESIQKHFSNSEIFNIFKYNKRILLFLNEEQMMIIDKTIAKKILTKYKFLTANYPEYFKPEIEQFKDEKWYPSIKMKEYNSKQDFYTKWTPGQIKYRFQEDRQNASKSTNHIIYYLMNELNKALPENFYELRKAGENDSPICHLIQKDSIKEFITYVNKNNIPFDSIIKPSIYETNSFLIEQQTQKKDDLSLIKYAAFFGSIQIFNYLISQDVELNQSLWIYAIHGQNAEIIHHLEENHVEPEDKSYINCLNESIICHHNDIVKYFLDNFIKENSYDLFKQSLKYYNFSFLKNERIDESSFFYLCKYDYSTLVNYLMKSKNIDVNENKEKSAFYVAVDKENLEIVKLLLMNDKTDVNFQYLYEYKHHKDDEDYNYEDINQNETRTAFYHAVEKENIDIIKLLLSNDKIDVNIPLIKNNNEEINYQDMDFEENETTNLICKKAALYLAIELHNFEIVKLLLTNDKIDINYLNEFNYSSLYYKDKFDKYIENNTNKKIIEQTALNYAIEIYDIEIIKILLMNEKLDINILNKLTSNEVYDNKITSNENEEEEEDKINLCNEKTAIYLAVEKELADIVELLLTNDKIDVNIPYKIFK